MSLPYDVHRCSGAQHDGEWREGCETCLRRTSPGGPVQSYIKPPLIVVFECEFLIEPSDRHQPAAGRSPASEERA